MSPPDSAAVHLAPAGESASPGRFLRAWVMTVTCLVVLGVPALDLLLLSWRDLPHIQWIDGIEQRKHVAASLAGGGGRLLVVGGSSALFSVDAELLEARLGMPACNIATHAGLGLRYLLADTRSVARAGDTVLLHLEYAHYRNRPLPLLDIEREALWTLHPERILQLPPLEALRQIYGLRLEEYQEAWKRRNREMAPVDEGKTRPRLYSVVELGPRGDYRAGAPQDKPAPPLELRGVLPPRKEAAKLLEEFFRWCAQHQVKIVAVRPAVVRTPDATAEEVERAYRAVEPFYLEHKVPLLDTRAVFQLPAELFFDTPYHATAAGRRIVTESIARELAPGLGRPKIEGDGTTLLVAAARSGWSRDLVLAKGAAPECRYLASSDLKNSLCLTPGEVRKFILSGKRVFYADDEVGVLLKNEGLESKVVEIKSSTLDRWMAACQERCIPVIAQFGQSGEWRLGSRTGRFDQGSMARVHEPSKSKWQRGFRFPISFDLTSNEVGKSAAITIDDSPIVTARESGTSVAFYDPALGTVVRSGVFQSSDVVEWQLREVQAPRP